MKLPPAQARLLVHLAQVRRGLSAARATHHDGILVRCSRVQIPRQPCPQHRARPRLSLAATGRDGLARLSPSDDPPVGFLTHTSHPDATLRTLAALPLNIHPRNPITDMKIRTKQTLEDIRHGRHREAYALFVVGLALVVLGLIGIVSGQILLSSILLALTFLVFHTSMETPNQKLSLDEILQTRDSFGPFSKILPGVRDLRIYGPTAVNVLVSVGDIRRFVLDPGGSVCVIIHDDKHDTLEQTAVQLDDNHLLRTLQGSIGILDRLAAATPGFEYRKLPFNPGFSLVIVDANRPNGYLIFESHGFKDENIADRMHIIIRRQDSPHWFSYWVGRFDAMWSAAHQPDANDQSVS